MNPANSIESMIEKLIFEFFGGDAPLKTALKLLAKCNILELETLRIINLIAYIPHGILFKNGIIRNVDLNHDMARRISEEHYAPTQTSDLMMSYKAPDCRCPKYLKQKKMKT